MDRKKLERHLAYLILFILAANSLANTFYWYYTVWYFDMIMHFLGGFWIGLLFFYIFSEKRISKNIFPLVLFFTFAIGVGWEVFEVVVNNIFAQVPFSPSDTLSDIFFDLAGGFSSAVYFIKKLYLPEQIG